mmetsp:Transcript_92310/g.214487  ORF Transcript_92310/g.214487 Transcript_92310/m.214487 type:complete len:300 (-) Transcript_92310:152-1051(-)
MCSSTTRTMLPSARTSPRLCTARQARRCLASSAPAGVAGAASPSMRPGAPTLSPRPSATTQRPSSVLPAQVGVAAHALSMVHTLASSRKPSCAPLRRRSWVLMLQVGVAAAAWRPIRAALGSRWRVCATARSPSWGCPAWAGVAAAALTTALRPASSPRSPSAKSPMRSSASRLQAGAAAHACPRQRCRARPSLIPASATAPGRSLAFPAQDGAGAAASITELMRGSSPHHPSASALWRHWALPPRVGVAPPACQLAPCAAATSRLQVSAMMQAGGLASIAAVGQATLAWSAPSWTAAR